MPKDAADRNAPPPTAIPERGVEVTRLEAFVDAAFAFAATLLVISFDAIPASVDALVVALKGVPAFAASFALLAMFWQGHVRWSRRYGLQDGASTCLSLALVFVVLVYVYPLKMLFAAFASWVSGGWLPSGFVIDSLDDLQWIYTVYAIGWSIMGLLLYALHRHAWRLRAVLRLSAEERADTRGEMAMWCMIPATGALSLLATLLLPWMPFEAMYSLPGVIYALMGFTGMVTARVQRRPIGQ